MEVNDYRQLFPGQNVLSDPKYKQQMVLMYTHGVL